jgi:hypothetical protein
VTWVKWKLISVCLEVVLIKAQESYTVYAERTIGSEIFSTHPMVLIGDVGQVEAYFGLFGDRVNLGVR